MWDSYESVRDPADQTNQTDQHGSQIMRIHTDQVSFSPSPSDETVSPLVNLARAKRGRERRRVGQGEPNGLNVHSLAEPPAHQKPVSIFAEEHLTRFSRMHAAARGCRMRVGQRFGMLSGS